MKSKDKGFTKVRTGYNIKSISKHTDCGDFLKKY